ncbi:Putative exosome complex component RRP41 [Toxocara canis]|uniref:Putative exosome complex component RRP41 n=1 Tax=Toxocara canis TaxID=6265 RepID=A0A0B2V1N1_TOXCA|nr:Putative exosome complex component RRP41 [Toxocara canis]
MTTSIADITQIVIVMNIISEHGFRQDGRKPQQIRNINYKLGVYTQADGSAYLEQGNTKVLCAVYGPHEPRQKNRTQENRCTVNCQYSMATFSTNERKERPRGDRRSMEFARLMEKAFETAVLTENYPRSQIDVFCELLQADGSHLAACVNAATLALADAGVPMRGLVAAASCACALDGTPCVDVSAREESNFMPHITIANISGSHEIVLTELQNRIHRDHLLPMLQFFLIDGAHVTVLDIEIISNEVHHVVSGFLIGDDRGCDPAM